MQHLLTITLIFFVCPGFAQDTGDLHIPTDTEQTGTINIQYNGKNQAGFFYKKSDSTTYIITAKHLLLEKFHREKIAGNKKIIEYFDSIPLKNKDFISLQISYQSQWKGIRAQVYMHPDDEVDIIAIKTDIHLIGPNFYNLSSVDVILGQDCYFLGFPLAYSQPYSLFQNTVTDRPFIRKAIVSGVVKVNADYNVFFLDGHNTFGFSGGPVIFYNYKKKEFFVMGVVSGYLPQKNEEIQSDGSIKVTNENSGIMIVCEIEKALEILK